MSKFSRAFRERYAAHFILGGGWLTNSDAGTYDETIIAEVRRLDLLSLALEWTVTEDDCELLPMPSCPAPAAAAAAEQTPTPYHAAAQTVASVAQVQVPGYNLAGYIEQMRGVSDETREKLREKFLSAPEARTA